MKFKHARHETYADLEQKCSLMEVLCKQDPNFGDQFAGDILYGVTLTRWHQVRKPFVNLYPAIFDGLVKTNPAIDPGTLPHSVAHKLGVFEIRIPECRDQPSFFLAIIPKSLSQEGCDIIACCYRDDEEAILFMKHPMGKVINIDTVCGASTLPLSDEELATNQNMTRLAVGVLMLAADPDYLDPVLLARDRGRTLDDEGHERAVRRARNRGVVGFDLGRDIEVSPHVRRPHFGIRHTGKGRAVPKLVPIKGSVIHKRKMTSMPSGFEDAGKISQDA